MKIALETLGCKLNQAETEAIARQFAEAGHRLVSSVTEADIYILNTCTVTHIADSKSRHLLRLAHRLNPQALVTATGCYAQRVPGELTQIDGVNLVAGNVEKGDLLSLLVESGFLNSSTIPTGFMNFETALRTRASIKIQDGCNNFCSYCIVPLVRGGEKSQPPDGVITEVKNRVAGGAKEVVLTGTEIGLYNYNGINLKGLLERILAETGVTRLRLSSLQPREICPELIKLWDDLRLCPHFHLSLQSGSDSVLKRMKRQYSASDYQQTVSLIRTLLPDAGITSDIITGFPGETDDEFEESFEFCRRLEFARIHIFPYSPRRGTEAALFPDQISPQLKKQRSQKLLALARESAWKFRQRFLGRSLPVLWEQQSEGIWSGLTPNYIKVYTRSDDNLTNQLLPIKLVKIRGDGVWGNCLSCQ